MQFDFSTKKNSCHSRSSFFCRLLTWQKGERTTRALAKYRRTEAVLHHLYAVQLWFGLDKQLWT